MAGIPALADVSRRRFLRQAGWFPALAGVGAPLALQLAAAGQAAAQTAGDYRALVCVFLFGGNDHFNTVLPTDAASWQVYAATRDQPPDSIALRPPGVMPDTLAAAATPQRLGGVLALNPLRDAAAEAANPGLELALHPELRRLRALFDDARRLAIVPNVGPLVVPTDKAQFALRSHPRPLALFSHNDQQNTWQALAPEGATRGWGGRMADLLMAGNERAVFTAISAAGNAVWLAGQQVRAYQFGSSGAVRAGVDAQGRVFGSADVGAALLRIAGGSPGGHALEADVAAVLQRSTQAEATLRDTLAAAGAAPFGTPPATGSYSAANDPLLRYLNPLTGAAAVNPLAQQLQAVARMVEAGRAGRSGVRRQVFFVSLGGFDTHDDQNRRHADLLARLDHGLGYFDAVLGAVGARDQVTTFTASDFGRTFTSNGDGTDHGWGAHQFVMGGAVRGGRVHGRMPVLGMKNAGNNRFDSSPDQIGNGSLLPQIAVEQLGATLGRWFGLSQGQLADVFPQLAAFDRHDLGLMHG